MTFSKDKRYRITSQHDELFHCFMEGEEVTYVAPFGGNLFNFVNRNGTIQALKATHVEEIKEEAMQVLLPVGAKFKIKDDHDSSVESTWYRAGEEYTVHSVIWAKDCEDNLYEWRVVTQEDVDNGYRVGDCWISVRHINVEGVVEKKEEISQLTWVSVGDGSMIGYPTHGGFSVNSFSVKGVREFAPDDEYDINITKTYKLDVGTLDLDNLTRDQLEALYNKIGECIDVE